MQYCTVRDNCVQGRPTSSFDDKVHKKVAWPGHTRWVSKKDPSSYLPPALCVYVCISISFRWGMLLSSSMKPQPRQTTSKDPFWTIRMYHIAE